jgi:hypothetical protein
MTNLRILPLFCWSASLFLLALIWAWAHIVGA